MRKITTLTFALLCLHFMSNAQITKGSTFLGGSLSFGSSSTEDDQMPTYKTENNNWGINPQFGKAISNNRIAGLFFNVSGSKSEQSQSNNNQVVKGSSYGGGVFLRNYYPLSSRFYLFGEANLGVNVFRSESKTNNVLYSKQNRTSIALGLVPGISFAAGRKLHLEAALNNLVSIVYTSTKDQGYATNGTINNTTKGNSFNAAFNANGFSGISIGLRWILPSKS